MKGSNGKKKKLRHVSGQKYTEPDESQNTLED